MTFISNRPMTKEELFEIVTKIVASPHTAITTHDKKRAVQILLAFDEYASWHWQDQEDIMCPWVNRSELDFVDLCDKILDELEEK